MAGRLTRNKQSPHDTALKDARNLGEKAKLRGAAGWQQDGKDKWIVKDFGALAACQSAIDKLLPLIGNAQHVQEEDNELRGLLAHLRHQASFYLRASGDLRRAADYAADAAVHFYQLLHYHVPLSISVSHLRKCLSQALEKWAGAEHDFGNDSLALHLFERAKEAAESRVTDVRGLEQQILELRQQLVGQAPQPPQPHLQPCHLPAIGGKQFSVLYLPPTLLDNLPDLPLPLMLVPVPAPVPAPAALAAPVPAAARMTPAAAAPAPAAPVGAAPPVQDVVIDLDDDDQGAPASKRFKPNGDVPGPSTAQPGSLVYKKKEIASEFKWDSDASMKDIASDAAKALNISVVNKTLRDLIDEAHACLFGLQS